MSHEEIESGCPDLPPEARSERSTVAAGDADKAQNNKAQGENKYFSLASTISPETLVPKGSILDGRYKILGPIGSGGMGTVFEAEQLEPVQRRVAVKIIRYGLSTNNALIRFHQERQVLALMDHSHIAKVYDGGVTEQGFPYFIMELIRGVSITKYCNERKLSVKQRLDLFKEICQAIQHAHQKGIIHRDIKPNNILVSEDDGTPIVKVIDFGVAKAVHGPLVDGTIYTEKGSVVGTLEYMAPEQAGTDQFDVDTRADIYSLGVILYELLTGSAPFSRVDLHFNRLDEAIRIIRQVDPPRPSTRLTTLSKETNAAEELLPGILTSDLKKSCNELDWVVMRCLEKDRTRRYSHVVDLMADINRFLEDKPVSARPPSIRYRMRKFIKRNRTAVIAASAILIAMTIGTVMTMAALVKAIAAQAEAKSENEIHKSLLQFINQDLFSAMDAQERADLGIAVTKDLKVRTLLDRAAKEIDNGRFTNKPEVEAALRLTIGKAYTALGMTKRSIDFLKKSVEMRTSLLRPDHLDIAEAQEALGEAYLAQGEYSEATQLFQKVLERWTRQFGAPSKETLEVRFQLCSALLWSGKVKEAETQLSELIQEQLQIYPPDQLQVLNTRNLLATCLQKQNRFTDADRIFEEITSLGQKRYGRQQPSLLIIMNNYAQSLKDQKNYAAAITKYQEIIPFAESIYEPDGVMLALYRNNYASLLIRTREYPEAKKQLLLALPVFVRSLGNDHEKTIVLRSNYAYLKSRIGDNHSAVADYQELKPLFIKTYGLGNYRTNNVLSEMLASQLAIKDVTGSLQTVKDFITSQVQQPKGTSNAKAIKLLTEVAELAKQNGKQEQVNAIYGEAITSLAKDHPLYIPLMNCISK